MEQEKPTDKPLDLAITKYEGDESQENAGDIFIPYINLLWKNRSKIIQINGIVVLITVFYQLLFVKPFFETTVTILPDYGSSASSLGGLGGIAAMAGISIGDGSNPSDIYKNLLTSEPILEPVVFARYKSNSFQDSVNLIEYFEIDSDLNLSFEMRNRKQFIELKKNLIEKNIKIEIDNLTQILDVTVRMPESQISAVVVNRLVESLDNYVRTKRKSNASIQRSYIEKRLSEVNDSLSFAEKESEKFQLNNKVTNQSPRLILEQSRFNRQILILQGVYIELARQLEIAKIDEIRNAPIVNIREYAKESIVKAGPSRLRSVFSVFILSMFLTVVYFLFKKNAKLFYHRLLNTIRNGV